MAKVEQIRKSSLKVFAKILMQNLMASKNYPEIMQNLWGNMLWSPSYFAGSCGGAPLEIIKQFGALYPRPEGRGFTAHLISHDCDGCQNWLNETHCHSHYL